MTFAFDVMSVLSDVVLKLHETAPPSPRQDLNSGEELFAIPEAMHSPFWAWSFQSTGGLQFQNS